MDKHLRPALVELIGTFALVFISAGIVCTTNLVAGSDGALAQSNLVAIALAEGLIYAAALTTTLPASGGFLNPAVALMLWVFRRLEGQRAIWLIGAQFVGAILAGLCVRLIFSDEVLRLPGVRCGAPHLNVAAFLGGSFFKTVLSGIAIELALTFLLTFAIFGTVLDPRAARMGGLGVGLTLTALVLFGQPLTGAAMNPARWLGPVIWELSIPGMQGEAFRDHMVYWIGPLFGALLAGAVYEFLILPASVQAETTGEPKHEKMSEPHAKAKK
ncbi:MAG: aquaporin [Gemmataceae bacterium]|nr:aquaporin [Gemmataceae bacterium]